MSGARPLRLIPLGDAAGPEPGPGGYGPPEDPAAAGWPAVTPEPPAGTDAPADARPDGPGDAPADGPGDGLAGAAGDGPGATLALPGLTVTTADRAAVLARNWLAGAGQSARRTATRPGAVLTDEPPSLAHVAAYYAAAPWLPSGAAAGFWAALPGRVYGYGLALPLVAALYGLAWLIARPGRLAVALIVVAAIAIPALA